MMTGIIVGVTLFFVLILGLIWWLCKESCKCEGNMICKLCKNKKRYKEEFLLKQQRSLYNSIDDKNKAGHYIAEIVSETNNNVIITDDNVNDNENANTIENENENNNENEIQYATDEGNIFTKPED